MAKATKAKTTKKATKKPAAAKRTTKKTSVAAEPQFMETRFTEQSLYWVIFGAAAIIFSLWLYSLDAKVRDLYDQIDANTYKADPVLNVKKSND